MFSLDNYDSLNKNSVIFESILLFRLEHCSLIWTGKCYVMLYATCCPTGSEAQ